MIRSEDGEMLARVSDCLGGVGVGSRRLATEDNLTLAGVWSSLHGDQRQDGHERGVSLSGHCQVSAEPGRERAGQGGTIWEFSRAWPLAFGGPLAPGRGSGRRLSSSLPAQPISSSSSRELKYRAGRQPNEPSFQIRDYVESQKKRPSCCSFL